jgi:hypothetical protein
LSSRRDEGRKPSDDLIGIALPASRAHFKLITLISSGIERRDRRASAGHIGLTRPTGDMPQYLATAGW